MAQTPTTCNLQSRLSELLKRPLSKPLAPSSGKISATPLIFCNRNKIHGVPVLSVCQARLKNDAQLWNSQTRKPCCRQETARCRSYLFSLKFANDIRYKFKSSQASKATLSSFKLIGALCTSPMRCLVVQPLCTGFHVTILTDVQIF